MFDRRPSPPLLAPNPPIAETTTPLDSTEPNVLYLAYGSNLNSAVFEGRRGIKPLSATAVTVPTLKLVFNLPGIAYLEPRFANVELVPTASTPLTAPLAGVVYKVTQRDYATIIATEGGGASYQDILVDCFPLDGSHPLIAHTLLAPPHKVRLTSGQPSARYLGLIVAGAEQHQLPQDYRAHLATYRPYRITSMWQRVGAVLFAGMWLPAVFACFGISNLVAKVNGSVNGRSPRWVVGLNERVFGAMWWSYGFGFKKCFGNGEKTAEERVGWGEGKDS